MPDYYEKRQQGVKILFAWANSCAKYIYASSRTKIVSRHIQINHNNLLFEFSSSLASNLRVKNFFHIDQINISMFFSF